MPKAISAIKQVLKEKDRGLRTGAEAIRGILEALHKETMAELGKAALGSWDAYHLRQVLDGIELQMASYAGKSKTALSGLLDGAWSAGKKLVDAPLAETGVHMGAYHLPTSTLETLKDYSNDYLENMFRDGWYQVKGEITLGVVGGKSPQEVAQAIGKTIDAGRFKNISTRAETITRHEMGTLFSQATQLRMEQASENVPELQKEWRHAGHPRHARPSHLAASGQRVPIDEAFNVGGVSIMFPRAPGAPLREIIHCGCDHVPWHPNWQ